MAERKISRRSLLATAAIAGVTALGVGGATSAAATSDWAEVTSPTGDALYDVDYAKDVPWAVGSSGNLLERGSDGWDIVDDDGPTNNNKTLYACDATNDGKHLWLCGSSGRVAYYDVADGTMRDHTNPVNNGTTYVDVVAWGRADKERVYLATSAGRVVVGTRDSSGDMQWEVTDTGSSYTVTGLDFHEREKGHAVTSGQDVYETTDGGGTWTKVGHDEAQVPFHDVVSGPDHVFVVGGNGQVFRRDCTCGVWTPFSAGSKDLSALERADEEFLGCGGSGRALRRTATNWDEYATPVGNHLNGCTLGKVDVIVGDSGVILERS